VQDPLGLNFRGLAQLSGKLLHCITSITPRARFFSFNPWCVLNYEQVAHIIGEWVVAKAVTDELENWSEVEKGLPKDDCGLLLATVPASLCGPTFAIRPCTTWLKMLLRTTT